LGSIALVGCVVGWFGLVDVLLGWLVEVCWFLLNCGWLCDDWGRLALVVCVAGYVAWFFGLVVWLVCLVVVLLVCLV
jgi:hypothetical protein